MKDLSLYIKYHYYLFSERYRGIWDVCSDTMQSCIKHGRSEGGERNLKKRKPFEKRKSVSN